MTASTAVHSNAFNFLSFIQSGVDPRTGLYTVGLSLHELESNDLRGPVVPLSLNYNPLNITDSGYGRGWNLALTQYTPSTQIVSVHSGETFRVTSPYPDVPNRLRMKEQKIESFQLYELSGDPLGDYKVVHKSGLVEILKLTGSNPQVAMPVRIYSPQGHEVTLTYGNAGDGRMLSTLRDSQGILLEIIKDTTAHAVNIRVKPVNGVPSALFVLGLEGDQLTRITLPTSNNAGWRFLYGTERGLLCIKEVWTPLGAHERVQYNDEGHGFPGNGGHQNLPRVTHHITDLGDGQSPLEVRYGYSENGNNFLGFNAPISWDDDGYDNLYKVNVPYLYGSTERLMVAGSAVRTVSRTFNRFHLLTSEATIRGNCLQTVETTYYADDGLSFEQQVRQCQLPRQVYTRWELDDDPREWREDKEISEYDIHGNQTLSVQANGITETTRYFPAEEVPGECPADPYGFVRHMREKTVTPASAPALVPDLQGGAPTLRTRYRYVEQPAISSSTTPWVALIEERLLEVNAQTEGLLERSAYSYFDEPSNHLLHGQRKRQAVTLGEAPGYTTFTDFEYSKPSATYATFAGEAVLLTKQILSTDFDSVGKEINEERSLLNGEPLLTSDKDVKIRYSYDALGRVLTETVAPDSSQHAATRTYSYGLIRPAGQGESPGTEQASQVVENVKGVKTRTWFDGLNRAIREERQDIDNAGENPVVFRAIYEASYDALGQLSSETEIDWLETIDMRQTSTYSYDLWGQQASVIGPDGVKSYTHSNPITFVNEEWTEGMGKTVTLTNRLEKPVTVERFDLDGETRISLHSYKYDGLGRTTYEKNAANHETMYAYDVYDRMLETTLPDRSKVQRQYAVHSRGDLPTLISVNDIVLGTQAFDGLERMIESITGGRKSTYLFDTNQSQPDRVIRPNGDLIAYEYTPELTEEPIKRTAIPKTAALATIEATYAYDPHNARLLESSEQGLALTRTYDSTGEVIGEKRDHDGVPYEMAYVYSRTGRLIRYTDVLGQAQRYHYDESTGRLEWTALGEEGQPGYIRTAFDYNAQGQTVGIETEDGASGQSVKIALEYDALGRETVRVFDFGETASRLSQTWNSLDQVERRLMSEGADAGGATLRDERYSYELRGRLEEYTCEGSQSPVDPYGKTIARQLFFFDALDNHEEVRTWFAGGSNTARFVYDEEDPAQLRRVINTHEDYPSVVELNYDANGNLLQDEEGRTLAYDGLGRLESVSEVNGGLPKAYRYDSEDTLSTVSSSSNDEQRFYRGDDLANRIDGEQQSTFMRGDGVVLAERQAGAGPKSLLLASDHNNSVLSEVNNGAANSVAYSAYGYPSAEQPVNTRLGYNGEFSEPLTGWQLLGNGYRAFNSTLMRFHSPDSWSPFGDGGVNAYAYCMGNPIMFTDPSGHRLLGGIIRFFGGATKNNKLARAAAQSWIDELKVNKLPDFVNVKKHQGPSIADIEKTYGAEVAQYYKYTDEVADRGIQYVKNVTRIENIASGRTYSKPSEVNLVIATTSKLKQEAVTRLNAQSELLRPTVPMRSGPKGPDFELAKIRKSGESSRKVRFDDHVKKMTY